MAVKKKGSVKTGAFRIILSIIIMAVVLSVSCIAQAETLYNTGEREFDADAYYEVMKKCAEQIREKTDFEPEIVLVLGSGLGSFADKIEIAAEIPYSDIDGFPVSTAPGHEGKLIFGTYKEKKLVIMKGRIHYYEGYSMTDVVLPLRTLSLIGAHTAILTCSAGSLNEEYRSGEFLILEDHITAFVPSPLIGDNVDELGERFVDMTNVYDKELRELAVEAAQENNIPVHSGVYIQVSGPQYETPTECRMYRSFGADAIGMSTAAEAVAAKHMGMKVCAISCLTCMGAGMEDVELSHEEVEKNAEKASEDFTKLITSFLEKLPAGTETKIFTDSTGREVEVPVVITKAAACGTLAQLYLFALCPDRLAGTSSGWTDEAKAYIDEKYRDLPELGQLYSKKGGFNAESLKDYGVQVIIDVGESNDSIREDMDELQSKSGIPVVHIQADLKTTGDAFRMLGDLLSMEKEAEELADFCEKVYDRSAAIAEAVDKVSILYLTGDLGKNVLANGSYHAEIIDMMAENLAVVDTPSRKGTGNEIDMEQIMNWDPDVMIFDPQSIYPILDKEPAWHSLRAIKEGKYYEAPCGPDNWMGNPPSVQRYLGLMWITKLLYPEEAAYDLYEDTAEYYRLFYHHELTKEQYDELVANSIGKMK